ncbi:3-carboxy-cis,cis-muconate cycloisomerase [Haloechinothrix halophila]|uniref:3-carboxy-cis,cis-muconate cycloisomerase n=1 Tax=Haloechinothrix halophila TaxID=1069073 RepID=UPI00041914D2|nr:3-carboxy-cis,cis-muconate cycloisomerase [Haloechinothrix halophila]
MSDGLFDGVLAAGPVAELVGDAAWLRAMLDVEAALARAEAEAGLIPAVHAEAIAAQCRAEFYDAAEIGTAATEVGNPAAPLVRALTARVGGEAAGYVHFGATSQDIVDTAAMLIARDAVAVLAEDVTACGEHLARLASEHVDAVQPGRTLLQHAVPVTFGLTAANWLSGMDSAADRLASLSGTFAVQCGGAAGTLAALGERGPDVVSHLAARLGLTEPALPWHTERGRVATLASAFGGVSASVAKIARDITLLAQTEVAEVAEPGPDGSGGSSTMPHKRNPIAAVSAAAAAAQAPGLVATLLSASAHEHQRAAGSWHAEWRPLRELLRGTGSAVRWLRTSLERLHVDVDRMRANAELTGGFALSEQVTSELVTEHGVNRAKAHDAVSACCASGKSLVDALAADAVVGAYLSAERIAELLDPASYLGSAQVFVQRALRQHHARKEG